MDLQFVLKKNLKKSRELAYYYIMLKSLHNVSQEEQMNMFVRFWNSKSGRVVTKCFHFHFFFFLDKMQNYMDFQKTHIAVVYGCTKCEF